MADKTPEEIHAEQIRKVEWELLKERLTGLMKKAISDGKYEEAANIALMDYHAVATLSGEAESTPAVVVDFVECFRALVIGLVKGMTQNEHDLHVSRGDKKAAQSVTYFGQSIMEVLQAARFGPKPIVIVKEEKPKV